MDIKLDVNISESKTTIKIKDNSGILEIITDKQSVNSQPTIYILLNDTELIDIGNTINNEIDINKNFNKIITITPSWDIELLYLEQILMEELTEAGVILPEKDRKNIVIPRSAVAAIEAYTKTIRIVLGTFGCRISSKMDMQKMKATKTQHRWRKEISQIEFFINSRESKGTVIWQKRNEMLLKAGAKLQPIAPLNKDGSIGFAAKMGTKIRDDHSDKIENFRTTEDIVLKSVNEIGLFLYFGGTNSWLELLDSDGKSIDEWSRVD